MRHNATGWCQRKSRETHISLHMSKEGRPLMINREVIEPDGRCAGSIDARSTHARTRYESLVHTKTMPVTRVWRAACGTGAALLSSQQLALCLAKNATSLVWRRCSHFLQQRKTTSLPAPNAEQNPHDSLAAVLCWPD